MSYRRGVGIPLTSERLRGTHLLAVPTAGGDYRQVILLPSFPKLEISHSPIGMDKRRFLRYLISTQKEILVAHSTVIIMIQGSLSSYQHIVSR